MQDRALRLADALEEELACVVGIGGRHLHAVAFLAIGRSDPGKAHPDADRIFREIVIAVVFDRRRHRRSAMGEHDQVAVPSLRHGREQVGAGFQLGLVAGRDRSDGFGTGRRGRRVGSLLLGSSRCRRQSQCQHAQSCRFQQTHVRLPSCLRRQGLRPSSRTEMVHQAGTRFRGWESVSSIRQEPVRRSTMASRPASSLQQRRNANARRQDLRPLCSPPDPVHGGAVYVCLARPRQCGVCRADDEPRFGVLADRLRLRRERVLSRLFRLPGAGKSASCAHRRKALDFVHRVDLGRALRGERVRRKSSCLLCPALSLGAWRKPGCSPA